MTTRSKQDPVAFVVVAAAVVAYLLEVGWWTPIVGTFLIALGPGYLLLNGVSQGVHSRVLRAGLYIGTSLAIAALSGFALGSIGLPLDYSSFALANLATVAVLFLVHLVDGLRASHHELPRGQTPNRQSLALGLVFVAIPVVAASALLATAPVRSQQSTELYLISATGQIRDLPTSFTRGHPIRLRIVASLGAQTADAVLEVYADEQLVEQHVLSRGSTIADLLVTVETEHLDSDGARIEVRLRSSTEPDHTVWLQVVEEPAT